MSVPKYRQRNPRNWTSADEFQKPKAYTVNEESRILIIRNIPALGVCDELVHMFETYGEIEENIFIDDHDDASDTLDVLWIRYKSIGSARQAKHFGVKNPFYGNLLQINYCPQDEQPVDTRQKLDERRKLIEERYTCTMHAARIPSVDTIGPAPPQPVNKTSSLPVCQTTTQPPIADARRHESMKVPAPQLKRRRI